MSKGNTLNNTSHILITSMVPGSIPFILQINLYIMYDVLTWSSAADLQMCCCLLGTSTVVDQMLKSHQPWPLLGIFWFLHHPSSWVKLPSWAPQQSNLLTSITMTSDLFNHHPWNDTIMNFSPLLHSSCKQLVLGRKPKNSVSYTKEQSTIKLSPKAL